MNIIPLLESQVIRALLVSLGALIGLVVTKLGYTFDDEFYAKLTDAALTLLIAGASLWAMWARATKPTPPLTESAAAKSAARAASELQGGFARTWALAALVALSITACGVLLPRATTFNKRLASGYSTVTAIRNATASWIDSKVVECNKLADQQARTGCLATVKADAQNIQDQADQARAGLDAAGSWKVLDVKTAEGRLAATLTILQSLQAYLGSK